MENTDDQKSSEYLEMQFDPQTIEHLGVQMYSTLPPVIAELISNSYDADAKEVKIELFDDGDKLIRISDNGHGMTFKNLNEKFLRIGRNRRKDEGGQLSESGKRLVIGKKGIGKLSFFGIALKIRIDTIRDGKLNSFVLDWEGLLKAGEKRHNYMPELLKKDEETNALPGTAITLSYIKRKTGFSPENIAYSLAKDMSVFNEEDFKVQIFYNNSEDPIVVKNEMRYRNLQEEHVWVFPKKIENIEYEYEDDITGKLIAAKDVVQAKFNGIALFSRGKLVNEYSFLDVNASSHDYSYITGWLNIDFIDNWNKEVISTNRRSLNWEEEETVLLKNHLESIYRTFFNEVKEVKAQKKIQEVEAVTGVTIESWIEGLPKNEKRLAKKLVKNILSHSGIETEKAGELISFIKDSFKFEAFRELATEIDENPNIEKIIEIFKEWKIIEARELYKLAIVRIKAIKNFNSHILNNAREVPIIHDFLVNFSWLLDPRLMNFKDETYYSKLLKDNYKDELLPEESDRRIDFLCHRFGDSFYIIELKRPEKVIGKKEFDQALEYVSFIRERLGNEYGKTIYCYVIGKKLADDSKVRMMADAFKANSTIYVKPYAELLQDAINYHQEFIDKYDALNEEKK